MIVRQSRGVPAIVAILLAALLVTLVVVAGFLWLQEADKRLEAEQKAASIEKKYDELKSQCDAMKDGGVQEGLTLENDSQQNPIVTSLEAQVSVPQCERPTIQPFVETMRAQDKNFFANANEGDVLVTYPLSKRAFLYRESSNAVINYARISAQ